MSAAEAFFAQCRTFDELRAEYKRLTLRWHPDRKGGDTETMKAVNAAYTAASARVTREASAASEKPWSERKSRYYADLSEKLRAVLERLLLIPDIEVEITGLWFWIDGVDEPARKGETKPEKEVMVREIGCRYAYGKRRWYFAGVPSKNRAEKRMGDIRNAYGSERVRGKRSARLDEAA